MAGESQETPGSRPDPTVMTTEAIDAAREAERIFFLAKLDAVYVRLDGMDKATAVLHETVTRVPTETQLAMGHLRELHDEKFHSVELQFRERDTRSERESRDNKTTVDTAFAAQKEAAAKQDEANSKRIDKSESSTNEKIDKLTELFRTEISGLSGRYDDMKERLALLDRRVDNILATKQGGREVVAGVYAFVGFLASILILGGLLAAAGAFGGSP